RARAEAISAKEQRRQAERQRERAEKLLGLGLAALDSMYLDVAAERLPRAHRLSREDEALLRKALAFYQAFVERAGDDPRTRAEVGSAYHRVADIRRSLGQYAEAEKAARAAVAVFRELADRSDEAAHQAALGRAYTALGIVLDLAGHDD